LGFAEVTVEEAIAGYAKSIAMTANAPTADAIAIFFVFIFGTRLMGALRI